MNKNDLREQVTELLRNGIKIVPRDERHTPEGAALLERVLNRLLRHFGRSCTVSLDRLAMVITLVAKGEGEVMTEREQKAAGKVYRGERTGLELCDGVSVTVDGNPLNPKPSQQVRNHSPDGFNWGYGGSGPAQLALAILLDVTGNADVAEDHYQAFKRQFVGGWGDRWEVTESQVREWLAAEPTRGA